MTPFLKQVADHYFAKGDNQSRCFIFPNRRSEAFFRKFFAMAVASGSERPQVMPMLTTVNDFYCNLSGKKVADKVSLMLTLYECYSSLNPKAESLDEFIFWGDVILSDFSEVDKYLADPKAVFTNVSDFRQIQDLSYLTPEQEAAISQFVSHFRNEGRLKVENAPVKENFLMIWDLLYPLYQKFNEKLASENLTYEGRVYRDIAVEVRNTPVVDMLQMEYPGIVNYVFVGLNALNEAEKRVMDAMNKAHLADFCWDYSSALIKDDANRSSRFMAENVIRYPQAFDLDDDPLHVPQVTVISVPSAVGQADVAAKYAEGDVSCAVVLPDETLLTPMLNCIDPSISKVNVTMGYPMSGSSFYALMNQICTMQLHLREKGGKWFFYYRQLHSIFSNSIFCSAAGEEGMNTVRQILADGQYYVPMERLQVNSFFQAVFRPVVRDLKSADASTIQDFSAYLLNIIRVLAPSIKQMEDISYELDFASRYYTSLTLLSAKTLAVQPSTWVRLLHQLLGPIAIPFEGLPLEGLQIMGPLETRALDFKKLIVLSCNEGMFPRRNVASSFIPSELRKGFGLPTYEHQDAVWAYYFYRMIQRSQEVILLFDSRTSGLNSGEESRYIKQLEYHFRIPVKRLVAGAKASLSSASVGIPKPENIEEIVKGRFLSASALKNYLDCQAKFFYSFVEQLSAEDEVSESMDAGMIGNVYHQTMQALFLGDETMNPSFDMMSLPKDYQGQKKVTIDYLRKWRKREAEIKARIRTLILAQMKSFEVVGRDLVYEEVILKYVLRTIDEDIRLLQPSGEFDILGLELRCFWDFEGYKFIGYIDRLDISGGRIRVVDYKTGKVTKEDNHIDDSNAAEIVESIFAEKASSRPKIALQLFLYGKFLERLPQCKGRRVVNAIYQPSKLFTEQVEEVPQSEVFMDLTTQRLKGLLEQITDSSLKFEMTQDTSICSFCDFKSICGR